MNMFEVLRISETKKRLLVRVSWKVFFLLGFLFLSGARSLHAEYDFFSHRRFILRENIASRLRDEGGVAGRIARFSEHYENGLEKLSYGDMRPARRELERARRIWPEFYPTDFLLAKTYEREGDHHTAARYYKSYLNKLQALTEGYHRASANFIRQILAGGVDRYNYAYRRIDEHLRQFGIEIEDVRPIRTLPRSLKVFFYILVASVILFFFKIKLIPIYQKKRRIKNPPEGFWCCRKCGTMNMAIDVECRKCGTRNEDTGVRS